MSKHTLLSLLALGVLPGCSYDENLPNTDLVGTIKIPIEALSVTLFDETTLQDKTIVDPRALGPVYLGAFASVGTGDFDYSHPEMGPIVDTSYPGNTYPYGGTSVGRFDWACYQSMVCKMVTGRFSSYDDVLDFYKNVVGNPVTDPDGNEVTSGVEFQERCYDVEYITSDDELAWLSDQPDFQEDADGEYMVAENVTIPHVKLVDNMAIWGWVDMPSRTFDFSTCDSSAGQQFIRYSETYYEGTNYTNILNYPSLYIDSGDWVADDAPTISDPDQDFEITLGYNYVE